MTIEPTFEMGLVAPSGCLKCGDSDVEQSYRLALCAVCRDTCAAKPFPTWTKVMAAIILSLFAVSLADLPEAMRAGLAFERGHNAEQARNFAKAAQQYRIVVDAYPKSVEAAARLGICYIRLGENDLARSVLAPIAGKTSRILNDEINRARLMKK